MPECKLLECQKCHRMVNRLFFGLCLDCYVEINTLEEGKEQPPADDETR